MKNSLPRGRSAELLSKRAVAYVRMSTDLQIYSTANQLDKIREYAASRNLEIVHIYEDTGKSGLTIAGRPALTKLIHDVELAHDFGTVLVYDISRWGRFQDIDESAYYERHCLINGVNVKYCAEENLNDGSMLAAIGKMVKRVSAADFSKDLSTKVFAGQCRMIRMGYKTGGAAIFGLSRVLLGSDGAPVCVLDRGQWKAIQNQRVIFTPGPAEEIEIVNLIFKWYAHEGFGHRRIAAVLNAQLIPNKYGGRWTGNIIRCLLKNEKYIGNLIYNKSSFKLKMKAVHNPPETWVRCDGAFPAIVPLELFEAAQRECARRNHRYSTDELIAILQDVYKRHGRISSGLINREGEPLAPSAHSYWKRFGTMYAAYDMAGIPHPRDYAGLTVRKRNYALKEAMLVEIEDLVLRAGGTSKRKSSKAEANSCRMRLNDQVDIAVRVMACRHEPTWGYYRWWMKSPKMLDADFVIAAQLDRSNTSIVRYFLFPATELGDADIKFTEETVGRFEAYEATRLADFFGSPQTSLEDNGIIVWAS